MAPSPSSVKLAQKLVRINSVPDEARIQIDLRTIPGVEHSSLVERLRGHVGGDIQLTRLSDSPCVWTDPDHQWIQETFGLLTPFVGQQPEPRSVSYFTDASVLSRALGHPPTLILGPGDAAMAHQTHESCSVEGIEQAADIYEALIRKWCGA